VVSGLLLHALHAMVATAAASVVIARVFIPG